MHVPMLLSFKKLPVAYITHMGLKPILLRAIMKKKTERT